MPACKKIVKIVWVDSHEADGWNLLECVDKYQDKEVQTAGFIVCDSEDGVTVAGSLCENPTQACSVINIPKSSILSIEELACGD